MAILDMSNSAARLSISARRVRWGWLGFTVAPLAVAYCRSWGYSVPLLTCPIRHLTGIPCPTCGMTRSFIAVAQGDLYQAVTYHLFGPILFIGFSVAAIHIILELLTMKQIKTFYVSVVCSRRFLLLCLIALLTYHAYRLFQLANAGELYLDFSGFP